MADIILYNRGAKKTPRFQSGNEFVKTAALTK